MVQEVNVSIKIQSRFYFSNPVDRGAAVDRGAGKDKIDDLERY